MGLLDKFTDQAKQKYDDLKRQTMQTIANNIPNQSYQSNPQVQHEQATPQVAPEQNTGNHSLYGDYIEQLIDMALADGELTEKEKQVLFKKAEANGIDLDEFEMVLDARLYERQKAMQAAAPMAHDSAPKSEKYGDVRKCPACGAIVESFTIKCPECGHEFRNVGSPTSIQVLFKKLEALESNRKNRGLLRSMYTTDKLEKQKANVIETFPVPTTKEDILEFLSLTASLAKKPSGFLKAMSYSKDEFLVPEAWWKKCKQVIIKARLSMRDDKQALDDIEYYAKLLKI